MSNTAINKFIRSVQLNDEDCAGCINCIKHCPTHAIRVHNGKARIIDKFCIDCGRCIKHCPHHAKIAICDSVSVIGMYKHSIALPAPALYSQFQNMDNVDIVLNALLKVGFDDVFEVSAAAELISEASRVYLKEHQEKNFIISSACPSIVRLIRIRFPTLLQYLLPLKAPIELAAELARKQAMEKTGFASEDIGIIFITPCPAKVSYIRDPLGIERSNVDHAIAIKDIYPMLLPHMSRNENEIIPLTRTGRIGLCWSHTGGEVSGLFTDSYLAADGIRNVIDVLEDLEDEKIHEVRYLELSACDGGCVGGVLNVENAYAAVHKTDRLRKYQPVSRNHLDEVVTEKSLEWTFPIEYEPVFRLGNDFKDSLRLMNHVEELLTHFPGLDCGSCGAPTCQALAEDIVRKDAVPNDCVYFLRDNIADLIVKIEALSGELVDGSAGDDPKGQSLRDNIKQLSVYLQEFNRHNKNK